MGGVTMRPAERPGTRIPRALALLLALVGSMTGCTPAADPGSPSGTRWHYAANGNFSAAGDYLPGRMGFNLADVSSKRQLDALPDGVKGLVFLGLCRPVDTTFQSAVAPFVGDPRVYGFYLVDEPLPDTCPPRYLAGESDWIHAHLPGVRTFVVVQNLSSSRTPSYAGGYNPANTHVDLFGIAPYPCRSELGGCDADMIGRFVTAAELFGIPRTQIVPVFQTFGGGRWTDDAGGSYVLPTAQHASELLREWARYVPSPAFDFVYSWGVQRGDQALTTASWDLQHVFADHNAG